jgi:hypothetical protein
VFPNFTDLSITHDVYLLASPDTHCPPLDTEMQLPIRQSDQLPNISFRKHSSGEYSIFLSENILLVITQYLFQKKLFW